MHKVATESVAFLNWTKSLLFILILGGQVDDNIPLRVMLLLMDEVFDLKERNQWLRRNIKNLLQQLIRATYGDTINRYCFSYIEQSYQWHCTLCLYILLGITKLLWFKSACIPLWRKSINWVQMRCKAEINAPHCWKIPVTLTCQRTYKRAFTYKSSHFCECNLILMLFALFYTMPFFIGIIYYFLHYFCLHLFHATNDPLELSNYVNFIKLQC